jgi:hypothetical protein
MRKHLIDIIVSDDDWFEFGGDSQAFVRDYVGANLFEQNRVGFEITFSTRNWNSQTQTITITLVADKEEYITWWLLQFTPKKYTE